MESKDLKCFVVDDMDVSHVMVCAPCLEDLEGDGVTVE